MSLRRASFVFASPAALPGNGAQGHWSVRTLGRLGTFTAHGFAAYRDVSHGESGDFRRGSP